MSKKELLRVNELTTQLDEQTMRLNELENEYEHYRTKTQTELIKLRDQNETIQGKLDQTPNVESILNELKESQFIVSEREAEIERLKQDFKQ